MDNLYVFLREFKKTGRADLPHFLDGLTEAVAADSPDSVKKYEDEERMIMEAQRAEVQAKEGQMELPFPKKGDPNNRLN